MAKQSDPRRSPISRLLHRGRSSAPDQEASNAQEPCLGCGEETAMGGVFYSDRREVAMSDGPTVYLCSECQSRAHRARVGEPLSDEDIRIIANNGMMIGAGFFTGGGI